MKTFIIGMLLGVAVGGVAVFLLFVGVPRASQKPGVAVKPPDATMPAGTAQIVLRQELFNEVLATIFRDMDDPAFPLARSGDNRGAVAEYAVFQQQAQCDGKIHLMPEGSGTQTAVNLQNGRVSATLAFTGSYKSAIGCFPFSGWAQANFDLRFDADRPAVYGTLSVETVNLDGINPILNGIVTPLVQSAINTRVNPIQILSGENLVVDLPVASADGNLRTRVRDVRSEVREGALHLYVVYDFSGSQPPA